MYLGCYKYNVAQTSLTSDVFMSSSDMTLDVCIKYCWAKDKLYAGLKNATDCWCSNETKFDTGDTRVDKACDKVCGGDSEEICGGEYCISVYKLGGNRDMKDIVSSKCILNSKHFTKFLHYGC